MEETEKDKFPFNVNKAAVEVYTGTPMGAFYHKSPLNLLIALMTYYYH